MACQNVLGYFKLKIFYFIHFCERYRTHNHLVPGSQTTWIPIPRHYGFNSSSKGDPIKIRGFPSCRGTVIVFYSLSQEGSHCDGWCIPFCFYKMHILKLFFSNYYSLVTSFLRNIYIYIYINSFNWLIVWVLWHINLCGLFKAKSIFMQIVLFQTIQFSMSTQFNCQKHFYFKPFSLVKHFWFS